jgi:hypothetical protein
MPRSLPLLVVLVLLVFGSGCATVMKNREKVQISAVIVNPESLVMVSFTRLGYSEQQVLIRVTAPDAMRDEVIAIPFIVSWGSKVMTYGDPAAWKAPIGTAVQFTIRSGDITNEWPTEHRRIHANRIRDVIWPSLTTVSRRCARPLVGSTRLPQEGGQRTIR